ncbi:GNAT family N-acetyltransferase [uncultured Amaricoccus sp.]|uniref:GNAT family N-acetyltransferase n=1 Tax=uncultured Amaricoccus sp. TaxID=339341 RepID=UPI00260D71C9|nr:GNAT family N-acetyltransferase [uncultured Amaricoccus sp.]
MQEAIEIRDATLADLPAVVAMLADDMLGAARETGVVDEAYLEAFRAIQAEPNCRELVAVLDGAVVGCFQLNFLPGLGRRGAWRAQIEAVRVAQGRRGRGVGAAMMAWAIARARERGCILVQLTTDKRRHDAHRFYRRLGFEATHEGMKLVL